VSMTVGILSSDGTAMTVLSLTNSNGLKPARMKKAYVPFGTDRHQDDTFRAMASPALLNLGLQALHSLAKTNSRRSAIRSMNIIWVFRESSGRFWGS
jgi:hypothetical protein